MSPFDWQQRIKAVVRAADAGDSDPLGIVANEIATMESILYPPPVQPKAVKIEITPVPSPQEGEPESSAENTVE